MVAKQSKLSGKVLDPVGILVWAAPLSRKWSPQAFLVFFGGPSAASYPPGGRLGIILTLDSRLLSAPAEERGLNIFV